LKIIYEKNWYALRINYNTLGVYTKRKTIKFKDQIGTKLKLNKMNSNKISVQPNYSLLCWLNNFSSKRITKCELVKL